MKNSLLRNALHFPVLALLLLAFLGCDHDGAPLAPESGDAAAGPFEVYREMPSGAAPFIPATEPGSERLARLWEFTRTTKYDPISAPISVADGGQVMGVPAGWPLTAKLMISVPPGAIPPEADADGDGFVTLSILVPRRPLPLPRDWAPVFRLEPHGIIFLQPVQVALAYPDWLAPTPTLRKFCLIPLGGEAFTYSDYEEFHSTLGPLSAVWFSTTHFSDWPVESGKGG